jgi:hypothetical protein
MDDACALLRSLNAHHVPHLVIGAYAMAFHGYSRPTCDFDVMLDPESDPVPALVAFGIAGLDPFPPDAIVRYGDPDDYGGRIDLTNIIEGVTFAESWPDRVSALFYGVSGMAIAPVPTYVIGLAALVVNKLASHRCKDHLDGLRLLQVASRIK